MNGQREKVFKLKLVKNGVSSAILSFTFIVILFSPLVLVITIQGMSKTTFFAILISDLLVLLLFFWKYYDRLLVKYESSLSFHPDHFQLDGNHYKWEEITWYKKNAGSKFTMGFVVGLKNKSTLRFYATMKRGGELNTWMEMVNAFEKEITQRSLQVRNYYASKSKKRLAKILIASNLIVPILSIALGFSSNTILVASIAWLFISLSYPIIVFTNQGKK